MCQRRLPSLRMRRRFAVASFGGNGMLCFAASDLHGRRGRYLSLLGAIEQESPSAVFLAGDLLPMPLDRSWTENRVQDCFLRDFLFPKLRELRERMGSAYPSIMIIMGNDDYRAEEEDLLDADAEGLLAYLHERGALLGDYRVIGYACIPPTPFGLKDWERYDVSRYVDPGCVSPEEGRRSVPVDEIQIRYGTIRADLSALLGDEDLSRTLLLFHSPPYGTRLDRADLDGQMVDHVPIDPHVGSIAISRLIESRQPLVTIHGHIHESTRITGVWMERIGGTCCFQAAHDGPELALIRFDPARPADAGRELIAPA